MPKTLNLPQHDHLLGPHNGKKSPTCPRCIHNARTTGVAIHTCPNQGAFGRRTDSCPRCQQLTWEQAERDWERFNPLDRDLVHVCSKTCFPVCTANEF